MSASAVRARLALLLPVVLGLAIASPVDALAAKGRAAPRKARSLQTTPRTKGTLDVLPRAKDGGRADKLRVARAFIQRGIGLPKKVVGYLADPRRPLRLTPETFVIGVMGGAGKSTPSYVGDRMLRLGGAIADAGHVILSGACGGLPDKAVIGAKAKGGRSIGISSYESLEEHIAAGEPLNFDVLQTTKRPAAHRDQLRPNYMGREIDNIERSDIIIIAGGRFGTLGELAIALEEKRPIGVLLDTGPGMANLVKQIVRESARAGKPAGAPVIYDTDPERLIKRITKATAKWKAAGGATGPLGDGFSI